jgi:hypothetical protein
MNRRRFPWLFKRSSGLVVAITRCSRICRLAEQYCLAGGRMIHRIYENCSKKEYERIKVAWPQTLRIIVDGYCLEARLSSWYRISQKPLMQLGSSRNSLLMSLRCRMAATRLLGLPVSCECCVSLRRADPSLRGFLPSVFVSLCVCVCVCD